MRPQVRAKLSYANVMATAAVFIALGGGAYAATLPKKSVGTKQLKKNAVKTAKIANATVTGAKLAAASVGATQLVDGSVSGSKIAPGAVGLPQAANSLHQNCPPATDYITGACIDDANRSALNFTGALTACFSLNGRLPTLAELILYSEQPGVTIAQELTQEVGPVDPDDDNTPGQYIQQVANVDDAGSINFTGLVASFPYRCVFNPLS